MLPDMMTRKLDRSPLPALVTIAESEIQTLPVETDRPILSLLLESKTAKPNPDIVTDTEPEEGIFVRGMRDTRATLKVTVTLTVDDDTRRDEVTKLLWEKPLVTLHIINESEIHIES
jgi:hypothetical protein